MSCVLLGLFRDKDTKYLGLSRDKSKPPEQLNLPVLSPREQKSASQGWLSFLTWEVPQVRAFSPQRLSLTAHCPFNSSGMPHPASGEITQAIRALGSVH